MQLTKQEVAKYIDHTCVKIDASLEDVKKVCEEAIKNNFHSVCVTPFRVNDAASFLTGTNISLIAVIGFPFGFTTTQTKVCEAKEAISNKATEIDMVININAIKDNNWDYVTSDITKVVEACAPIEVKVILETGLLTEEEIKKACIASRKAGAKFVKTATGFGPRGAELHDINIMNDTVGDSMKIKASGGIHDLETAVAMIEAGADRIGTSSGMKIIGQQDIQEKPKIKFNY